MAVKVFVSYAHNDAKWLDEVSTMLRALQTSGVIEAFDDRLIKIGEEWDEAIKAKLEEADLVILLVTFAFLGSTYINRVEIAAALQKHKEKRGRILPIIVEACDWNDHEWAKIDAWPTKESVVLPLEDWPKPHEALTQISRDLREWAKVWVAANSPTPKIPAVVADLPAELLELLDHLLVCCRSAAANSNFAVDLPAWTEALIEYARDLEIPPLDRTLFLSELLSLHDRCAQEHLLDHHFAAVPIAETLARLDAFCSTSDGATGPIGNTQRDDAQRYDEVLLPLRDAVDTALTWVAQDAGTLRAKERVTVRGHLCQLKASILGLSIDPKQLDRLRAKLEPYKVSVLRRCVILTQVLLGRDAAQLPPGTVFRDADASWAPEMVVIPPGSFMMGSSPAVLDQSNLDGMNLGTPRHESPRHRVSIQNCFAFGRYPVTFDEYDQYCAEVAGEKPGDLGWGRGRRPVINLSIEDGQAYLAWLSGKVGRDYRLPSEAEWEYACRAGTTSRYSFGDEIDDKLANYGENVGKTSEVGSYPPNPWGLFDMHGNVWEPCADSWHDSYDDAPDDGSAWIDAEKIPSVWRGGSWDGTARGCRSACRDGSAHVFVVRDAGLRAARIIR